MPSHSNSSPLALLPLGFMLAYTLVHKYCCQTWRMGLCQFLTWCQKGPCHRLMNGNHTGHWFGAGECRPSGKLTEKEACYRTCRSWKLWSPINVWGRMKLRCSLMLREQAKWSRNGTFPHEPPGAELQSTVLIRGEHRRHALELTKLLCFQKRSDCIVPNRHGGKCKNIIKNKPERHETHCTILIKHFFQCYQGELMWLNGIWLKFIHFEWYGIKFFQ